MSRRLIPHKIIINFEGKAFRDGLLIYRIEIDNKLDKKFKSIQIKNMPFNKPAFYTFLKKIRDKVKEVESAEDK